MLRSLEKTQADFAGTEGDLGSKHQSTSPVFIRFLNLVNNNKISNKSPVLRASIFSQIPLFAHLNIPQKQSFKIFIVLAIKYWGETGFDCRAQSTLGIGLKIKGTHVKYFYDFSHCKNVCQNVKGPISREMQVSCAPQIYTSANQSVVFLSLMFRQKISIKTFQDKVEIRLSASDRNGRQCINI